MDLTAPDTAPASTEPAIAPAEGSAEAGSLQVMTTEQVANALPPADADPAKDVPSPALAPEPFPLAAPAGRATAADHPAYNLLVEAEELCLYWGGEVGGKLRDLVCKARDLL